MISYEEFKKEMKRYKKLVALGSKAIDKRHQLLEDLELKLNNDYNTYKKYMDKYLGK